MLTPFAGTGDIDWHGVDALTDWYIQSGVDGLFSVCQSSEMYDLTPEERLALARRVVARVNGRVPVVASGTFGGPIEEQAEFVRRMADTGVDAIVVIVCQLVERDDGDDAWMVGASRLLDLTTGVPLGLYECPRPYHRLLSPRLLKWAASTGRFRFHKDTSCHLQSIRDKVEALRSTELRFFNAHTPTLLDSLIAGGDGFCGVAANFYPELHVWLARNFADHPETAVSLQRFLSIGEMVVRNKYPSCAKRFLALSGVPIEAFCRSRYQEFGEDDWIVLEHLRGAAIEMGASLPQASGSAI